MITHGYWMVALIVGLESVGLPLPGETILVLAAIYAATQPSFNVWMLVAVAAFGAIAGDNIGYWLRKQLELRPSGLSMRLSRGSHRKG